MVEVIPFPAVTCDLPPLYPEDLSDEVARLKNRKGGLGGKEGKCEGER